MEIKIPEDVCKQALEDFGICEKYEQEAKRLFAEANSALDQSRGMQVLIQNRIYKSLDMAPQKGDNLVLDKGLLVRMEVLAEQAPAPVQVPPAGDWSEPPTDTES